MTSATPDLSRRGFLGAGLALVAAPAIVRAESLMRIVAPPDWRDFVREVYAYNIFEDEFVLRYDIKAGGQQWHVDGRLRPVLSPGPNHALERFKAPALACLSNILIENNVSPYSLERLPLPRGFSWAKTGVR